MKRASKSPFELMAFLKDNPDPLGVKEKGLQKYSMSEVAEHSASTKSVWTVYRGKVYDITMYLDYHPGGKQILESVSGKDCTELFGMLRVNNI